MKGIRSQMSHMVQIPFILLNDAGTGVSTTEMSAVASTYMFNGMRILWAASINPTSSKGLLQIQHGPPYP
jgi:hypothetical protein